MYSKNHLKIVPIVDQHSGNYSAVGTRKRKVSTRIHVFIFFWFLTIFSIKIVKFPWVRISVFGQLNGTRRAWAGIFAVFCWFSLVSKHRKIDLRLHLYVKYKVFFSFWFKNLIHGYLDLFLKHRWPLQTDNLYWIRTTFPGWPRFVFLSKHFLLNFSVQVCENIFWHKASKHIEVMLHENCSWQKETCYQRHNYFWPLFVTCVRLDNFLV